MKLTIGITLAGMCTILCAILCIVVIVLRAMNPDITSMRFLYMYWYLYIPMFILAIISGILVRLFSRK